MNEAVPRKWKLAGPLKVCFCVIFHKNENVPCCSKWISRETGAPQDLPDLSAGLVFSSHLSLFKLLLKPFSFLALICLRSTAVEPTFLKANLRQLSWTCLSLTNAPPFCASLNPGVSGKVVMFSLLSHFPTHPPQDSVAVLFINNRKVEQRQALRSGYPLNVKWDLSLVSCTFLQPFKINCPLTFQNKLSPTCFPPIMNPLPKKAIPFILVCFDCFHSSFTKKGVGTWSFAVWE